MFCSMSNLPTRNSRRDVNHIRELVHRHMVAACELHYECSGRPGWGEESVLGYIPLTASPSPHRPLVTREPAWGMHT